MTKQFDPDDVQTGAISFDPDDVQTGPIRGFNPGDQTSGGEESAIDTPAEIIEELRAEIRQQVEEVVREAREHDDDAAPTRSATDDPESGR
jgi:hypothetical protein